MTDKVMVLQNCLDLVKVEPDSGSEAYHDGNHFITIKVEKVTDIQEEEGPVLTFPVIKAEDEVSHMCVCRLITFDRYTEFPVLCVLPICLSST
jgi:hypothetical protein